MSRRLGAVLASIALTFALTSVAAAERPRTGIVPGKVERVEMPPQGLVPYNTVYLNQCASGCTIRPGTSNSINDTWDFGSQRVLTKFPYGAAAWDQVVACVKDVFSPFQINVVTASPGSANHFEIMIAGAATDLNSTWTNYGGVAPGYGTCNGYINNALVFAFAKAYGNNSTNECDANCVNEMCATAAQEIGHVWRAMDHVRLPQDPMTYFGYVGRRYYQNTAAQCGSDCVDGFAPGGQACSGTSNQSHVCNCGGDTQNSYEVVKGLFGLGPGTPPTTKITSPKLGDSVEQGFSVFAEVSDDSMLISKVDFKVDGAIVTSLTKGPFTFGAPTGLADGTHHVEVIAYDAHQTPGSAAVDVIIGPPCEGSDDCPNTTDACVGGRCVPGPSVDGGLGTSCADSTSCRSGRCASDGTDSYCVELCTPGQCPDDFGCLDTGEENGVCWPGYDDGSGGCGCQTTRGGPAGLILFLLVMVVTCRRRRR